MKREQHILTIDAGHTRIKFALCACIDHQLPAILEETWTDDISRIDWPHLQKWLGAKTLVSAIITGSNQPCVEQLAESWAEHFLIPLRVLNKQEVPIQNETQSPEKVGVDRLLTSVAANVLRDPHQPVIVVDSGTAVTVDYVNSVGAFCGGAILPGVRLGAKALHEYTTTLPHFDAHELLSHVPEPLGDHTEAAIASGLYWGHVGAVRELVTQMQQLTPKLAPADILLLLTGGAVKMLMPHFSEAQVMPYLSLQGLALTALHLEESGE